MKSDNKKVEDANVTIKDSKAIVQTRIRPFDPVVAEVLSEVYEAILHKKSRLSTEEMGVKMLIEKKCNVIDVIEQREIMGVVDAAKRILRRTSAEQWTTDEKHLFSLLQKIVFVTADDDNPQDEIEQIHTFIEEMLRLDYSKNLPTFEVCNEIINIYNQFGLGLNLISEKFKESTLSAKAVNNFFTHYLPNTILIVTDKHFKIRFVNKIGERFFGSENVKLIGEGVFTYIHESDEIVQILVAEAKVENHTIHLTSRWGEIKKDASSLSILPDNKEDYTNGEEDEVKEYIFKIELSVDDNHPNDENQLEAYQDVISLDNLIQGFHLFRNTGLTVKQNEFVFVALENLYRLKEKKVNKLSSSNTTSQFPILKDVIEEQMLFKIVLSDLQFYTGIEDVVFDLRVQKAGLFMGDLETVSSVLKHLVGNAIKYRNKENKHTIIEVLILDSKEDEGTTILVKDNGIGISTKYHSQIFEKGFRIDDSVDNGFGLGLYFTKSSLTRIGGAIEVDSKRNKGSVFTVTLPF